MTILFVDDDQRLLDGIRRAVRLRMPSWSLHFATNVASALEMARELLPDVIVSDVTMPGEDGFALLTKVVAEPRLSSIPVVMLTGLEDDGLKRKALDAGAVDLLSKPIMIEEFIARIHNALKLKRYEDQLRLHAETLEQAVAERTRELESSRLDALFRLALAGEHRDNATGRHVVRVAHFSRRIATSLGRSKPDCDRIFIASPLHDIGKIGLPDHILHKPGKLTPEEIVEMQRHCQIGYQLLCGGDDSNILQLGMAESLGGVPTSNSLLQACARIALEHHERWDGSGYPNQLKGTQIDIDARIVAVADVLDALASPRPYKGPLPATQVHAMLAEASGTHFDPDVWRAADNVWNDLVELYASLADPAPIKAAA